MKGKPRAIVILSILFGYVLLQFIWWEVLLVKQTGTITEEKQRLIELSSSDPVQLEQDINELHRKKNMRTIMIVGEGTVFLLLLLFGIYKIKQAQDKEQELNERQKNFFLSITHELKTPIAATKLQLQTLRKQQLDEATRNMLVNSALVETERLNALIDNVLLASSLEGGEMIARKERTNLSALTLQILERYYSPQIQRSELIHHIHPDIEAMVDGQAMLSILTNLVDNALKYSGETKQVEVVLSSDEKNIRLCVSDQGPGITDKDKQKIFTRFFRGGSEETRRTKGTGLGLYIVNYLVQQHQGKITVKDNKPRGSIFEIQFYA